MTSSRAAKNIRDYSEQQMIEYATRMRQERDLAQHRLQQLTEIWLDAWEDEEGDLIQLLEAGMDLIASWENQWRERALKALAEMGRVAP